MYEPARGRAATPRVAAHHVHFRDFLSRRNQARFVAKWAAALAGYEPPPATEAGRAVAEEIALRRAENAGRPRRAAGNPGDSTPPTMEAIDDEEALAAAGRHLLAAVEVRDEYIEQLEDRVRARGVRDVARALAGHRLRQVRQRLAGLRVTARQGRGRRS